MFKIIEYLTTVIHILFTFKQLYLKTYMMDIKNIVIIIVLVCIFYLVEPLSLASPKGYIFYSLSLFFVGLRGFKSYHKLKKVLCV